MTTIMTNMTKDTTIDTTTNNSPPSRGLIVGRFNLVHLTHYDLITYLFEKADEVVVALGSAQYGLENPRPGDYRVKHCLTLDERIEILKGNFAGKNLTICPIYDNPSDEQWGKELLESVGKIDYVLTEKADEKRIFADRATILTWPYQSDIRGGIVIDHILNNSPNRHNSPYRHLLPEYTAWFVQEHGIGDRLRALHNIDVILFSQSSFSRSSETAPLPNPHSTEGTEGSDDKNIVVRTLNAEELP